jgi:hypothetical protein
MPHMEFSFLITDAVQNSLGVTCFWTGDELVFPDVPIKSKMIDPESFVVMKKRIMLKSRRVWGLGFRV